MKKILFDASVHFGQFSLESEDDRVGCKNSQTSIGDRSVGDGDIVGIITFNENSWADHVIWDLDRETQDIFYKFMDLFHSIKQIERIPLTAVDTRPAEELSKEYNVGISHALTCAVAIRMGAHEIHTLYKSMFTPALVAYMKNVHSLQILRPKAESETTYQPEMERAYQDVFKRFKNQNIDVLKQLIAIHC